MRYGYARVSTQQQTVRSQMDALEASGVRSENIVVEQCGGTGHRPELRALVARLEPGDSLVVTRLDRLGRSTLDLHTLLAELTERGIRFESLKERVDTTGIAGKLLLHLLVAIAEWEREALRERVTRGMASARARGVHVGRPFTLKPVEERAALAYAQEGVPHSEIARRMNCSEATVRRTLKRQGWKR